MAEAENPGVGRGRPGTALDEEPATNLAGAVETDGSQPPGR